VDAVGSRIVLADIPLQPLVSIGQFMHAQPFYMFNTGAYTAMGFGSMFVGGSVACPEVPLNQSALDIVSATQSMLVLDQSFLANQALFDSYFFSTVPPAGSPPTGTTWPEAWTNFNAANGSTTSGTLKDSTKPLLNSRIKPIYPDGQPPQMADLRDMDKAAANLMLNGAFNVNSTSVDAWRALLSSLSGNDLSLWSATDRAAKLFSSATLKNPISRFAAGNSNGNVNVKWSGVRALSDDEITDLATKIVKEVKARGPFLSMADFLNRRLGSTSSDITRAGALQAAIDKTTLNNAIKSGFPVTTTATVLAATGFPRPIAANMYDASSASGAVWDSALGMPGYLMQQDLVQAFSPVMTVRSDTFVIRVYGEVKNFSGAVEGRAWGEAVVQRYPQLVDNSQAAESTMAQIASNPTNKTFGRRFKVVSFRWLSPNEI
jgi:hypothetical protein